MADWGIITAALTPFTDAGSVDEEAFVALVGYLLENGSDGVVVFAPDATPIGQVLLPEGCTNLCFGGPAGNRLFMTASRSVYALYVNATGA